MPYRKPSLRHAGALVLLTALVALTQAGCHHSRRNTIPVGLIAELSGSIPAVGASCRNGALLAVKEINDAGGLQVGPARLKLELAIEDSGGRPDQAAAVTQKLITRDRVLAIVGPNASSNALPAAEIAEKAGTLLITPWSTNPKTTLDAVTGHPKRFVFRACFTDTFEGRVLGRFARGTLKAKRAAILYDVASDVLKSQAEQFRADFTADGGQVVAFESYTTGDKDFSAQLTTIRSTAPDVLFLPSYYTDVPLQMRQARSLGITAPFLGSDAWSTEDLIHMCGSDCEGAYLVNHYSPASPKPASAHFIAAYRAEYRQATPDDVAALSYDAVNLLAKAIQKAGRLNKVAIRDAMAQIRNHEGATGTLSFPGVGDPVKGAVILQIRKGAFAFCEDAQP